MHPCWCFGFVSSNEQRLRRRLRAGHRGRAGIARSDVGEHGLALGSGSRGPISLWEGRVNGAVLEVLAVVVPDVLGDVGVVGHKRQDSAGPCIP